jgi:3-oxoacyl-[acyl-carrier-protein] synthase-3
VGDGAVAEVVGRVEPGLGVIGVEEVLRAELSDGLVMSSTDGRARWTDPATDGARFVDTVHNGESARTMARRGPEFAAETCGQLLARHGYRATEVDLFACTQPSMWFGAAAAEAVGVRPESVVPPSEHFQRYGHLLPASAPLNLWVAWRSGRLSPGDLVLTYLQGAGFIQAAVLFRWSMPRPG